MTRGVIDLTGALVLACSLLGGAWWTFNAVFNTLATLQRQTEFAWRLSR